MTQFQIKLFQESTEHTCNFKLFVDKSVEKFHPEKRQSFRLKCFWFLPLPQSTKSVRSSFTVSFKNLGRTTEWRTKKRGRQTFIEKSTRKQVLRVLSLTTTLGQHICIYTPEGRLITHIYREGESLSRLLYTLRSLYYRCLKVLYTRGLLESKLFLT